MSKVVTKSFFFLTALVLIVGAISIFFHTKHRVSKDVFKKDTQKEVYLTQTETKETPLNFKTSTSRPQNFSETNYDEWCEAKDYVDLSNHEIFRKFETWVSAFEKINCYTDQNCTTHLHDPRKLAQILTLGEKLSLERKKMEPNR